MNKHGWNTEEEVEEENFFRKCICIVCVWPWSSVQAGVSAWSQLAGAGDGAGGNEYSL